MIHVGRFILGTIASISLIITTASVVAADCTKLPNDPKGDVGKLKSALQNATNTGKALRLTGRYYIAEDIRVFLKRNLVVDATDAVFIATPELDGDMFSFDTHRTKSKECNSEDIKADFRWSGGSFNMADAKVSLVVPYKRRTPEGRQGTKKTADALSIRGVINSNDFHKLNEVVIQNIKFVGTKSETDPFYLAGGDSGILMTGALKATIKDNSFIGVRDAAVYLSAGGKTGDIGGNFTISNNYFERAFDGATTKRGASNIVMENNTLIDVAIGLSIKKVFSGWTASNITIKGNTINGTMRGISVEQTDHAVIEDNVVKNLGAVVSGQNGYRPVFNKYSDAYEGISLIGVRGESRILKNEISSVHGSRESETLTWGIVSRAVDGRETEGVSFAGNVFTALDTNIQND